MKLKMKDFSSAPSLLPILLALAGMGDAVAQEAVNHPAPPPLVLPAFKGTVPAGQFQLPPVPVEAATPAGSARRVERIRFQGNQVIDTATLAAIARPYEGRDLDPATIEDLRQKISRHYIDAGYINSGAALGAGSYADGTLTFTLIEGRLSAVRLKGLGNLDEGYVVSRLVPDEDAALNADALRERFQMLLGDPLFARAQARVIPDAMLGRAVLDIEVERALPYQLSFFTNNSRSASVGENALGVTGSIRNLTGWGDFLEVSLQGGAKGSLGDLLDGDRGSRQSLIWRMPVGGQGTEISLQADQGLSTVQEEPAAGLDIQSRLNTFEIGMSQRLFENLSQRLTLGLNYNERSNHSSLLGQSFSFVPGEVDGVTHIEGWRFWQEYSHRGENQALVLRSTLLANDTNLLTMTNAPDRANTIWLGQGHYAYRFAGSGAQLSLKGTTQHSRNRLSSLDRMSIGGAQSVRGFRENQLIRDEANIANLDFDYPVWRGTAETPILSAGLFTDAGNGKNHGESRTRLASTGITLKARYQGWRFDLAYAIDRHFPGGISRRNDTLQDKGIHFQLNYDVFGK